MNSYVKPRMLGYATRIVDTWKNKPKFVARALITRVAISVQVYPTGEHAKLWKWISRGTGLWGPSRAKYPIPKSEATRNKKALSFPSAYTPKTSPGGRYKGPGKSSGEMITVNRVMHPGIKPRHFEEAWARWAKPWFGKRIENAIRRGARRV